MRRFFENRPANPTSALFDVGTNHPFVILSQRQQLPPMGMPAPTSWRVAVGADSTSVVYEPAAASDTVFVCAHGAGGSMDDRGTTSLAAALRARGIATVRFNFLYKEKSSARPDPMPRLVQTFTAVVESVRERLAPQALFLGGRSMGGRTASMMAAQGFPCDGLLLYAYPLHPAKQPEKLRDAHLPSIRVPVLCCNGTKDALCTRSLMEAALATVTTRWDMHWIDGADHSFHVLKSSGRTDAAVLDEVADATQRFVADVRQGTTANR
jgi:uncharacterized protein